MLYNDEAIGKRRKRVSKIRNIVSILLYIILFPLLIYNISLILQTIINPDKTPSFFGIKTYVIISGSMEPSLNIGDVVIVKNVKNNALQIGDIISFRQGQNVITHRITDIVMVNNQKQYRTKGDNNNAEDSGTINIDIIEGKVINSIPFVGKIVFVLQNKILIILILIILFIVLSYSGKKNKRKSDRRRKRIEYEENKLKNKD